jgi:deazaflavin-dependent oxidoreductase (nitroreductase family)
MPLVLYRHRWGWALGHTFLLVVHAGRKTRTPHTMVAQALAYDPDTHEVVICSAWGPESDWWRNIQARPALHVQIGRESFTPEQHFLSKAEAFAVAVEYRRRHPWRLRLETLILGWGDLSSDDAVREFVRQRPFVSFHPANQPQAQVYRSGHAEHAEDQPPA